MIKRLLVDVRSFHRSFLIQSKSRDEYQKKDDDSKDYCKERRRRRMQVSQASRKKTSREDVAVAY